MLNLFPNTIIQNEKLSFHTILFTYLSHLILFSKFYSKNNMLRQTLMKIQRKLLLSNMGQQKIKMQRRKMRSKTEAHITITFHRTIVKKKFLCFPILTSFFATTNLQTMETICPLSINAKYRIPLLLSIICFLHNSH